MIRTLRKDLAFGDGAGPSLSGIDAEGCYGSVFFGQFADSFIAYDFLVTQHPFNVYLHFWVCIKYVVYH